MSKNVNEYIEKATENINEDRASTKVLLLTLMNYMKQGDDRHKEVGLIAAKYLETLQRSNEQLVKLAALIQKKENVSSEITDEDKQDLFDLINQDKNDE
tara:strand:+ start:7119 stop:7415 length:297 start_codon:yes stop_codon:yes gene_type:complete